MGTARKIEQAPAGWPSQRGIGDSAVRVRKKIPRVTLRRATQTITRDNFGVSKEVGDLYANIIVVLLQGEKLKFCKKKGSSG